MDLKNEETGDHEYQRAFTALDELNLAGLKPFFKDNYLQDDTFSYMKCEEELRTLLRKELDLPFGQAFKFSRHWFKKYHKQTAHFTAAPATAVPEKKESKNKHDAQVPHEDEKCSKVVLPLEELFSKDKHKKKEIGDLETETESVDGGLVVCSHGKYNVKKENVTKVVTLQDENKHLVSGQFAKMNALDQTESLRSKLDEEDDLLDKEVEATVELKMPISKTPFSFNGRENKKDDPSGLEDSNESCPNFSDLGMHTDEDTATAIGKSKDTRLPNDECHHSREKTTKSEKEKSETDRPVRLEEEKNKVLNQQCSSESKTQKKKKKKANRGTGNNAVQPLPSGRKEGPSSSAVSSEGNNGEEGSQSKSDLHHRESLHGAETISLRTLSHGQARTAAAVYELSSEPNENKKTMDHRTEMDKRKALNQQCKEESRSKEELGMKKEASKLTENPTNTTQTMNRNEKRMTEGRTSSDGLELQAVDHQEAADGVTTTKDDFNVISGALLLQEKSENTIIKTDTLEANFKVESEKYYGESYQGALRSKTNEPRKTSLVNTCGTVPCNVMSQYDEPNHDRRKALNKVSESKGIHSTDEKTGDQGESPMDVTRCTPRPRGVPGRTISYEKGSVLDAEENREVEFKSLVNANPCSLPWKIMEKAKKFICACLNAARNGIIYFGVGDNQEKGSKYHHGEIIGLHVEHMRDDINKAFQFVIDDHIKSDAGPLEKGGEQNCVNIYFVPVKSQGRRSCSYIIEIEVTRDWPLCKDKVYYSKSWIEKRGVEKDCCGKKALSDFFKVKDEWDHVAIRTNGASTYVKPHEVESQVKKPLEIKYKTNKDSRKHGPKEIPEEISLQDADVKKYTDILRERLRELNYKENGYILVANKLPAQYRGTAHLCFLKNIPWVAVFDLFDPSTKRDGLFHACNETTDAPRAKIRTLDDFKEISPDKESFVSTRGTTWILSNDEMQNGDWIKCSKDCLYRALSAYKQCFLSGTLLCVFLCFNETAVSEMADIMENCFSILGHSANSTVTIISESKDVTETVIKASKPSLQKELKECSITGISWSLLKEIVRELMGPSKFEEKGATTELPHFTGLKEVLSKIVHSWEDLEVYCPNPRLPRLAEAIEKERDAFYKGAQASQINLFHNHSIPRSLEKELTGKLERALKSLSKEDGDASYHVKTVTVSYEPGSGATTLCRRILWNKRNNYRCAVVKAITSSTAFQIEKLQSIGYDEKNIVYSLPVLLLVDNVPENDVRLLTENITKQQTRCVVLTTLPISQLRTHTKFEITLGKLDERETTQVKNILINITKGDTEKRRGAEQVLEREKRFIWFGLELFGREYLKIKERLHNHIQSILMAFMDDSRTEHQKVLDICCFLSKYSDGFVIFPHSAVSDILDERASRSKQMQAVHSSMQDVHDVFGGLLLEEQNQTNGYYGWRPAHSLVSEVVTSKISVEETAIIALEKVVHGKAYVMKFLRHQVFRLVLERKRISDPVFVEEQAIDDGTVGTDLENEVFGFYGRRTRYSPVIMDILENCIQGALKVLLTVCELTNKTEDDDKAYAWQQLARFIGYEMRFKKMDGQEDLLKRLFSAMKKESPGKQSMPTTGIEAAHVAVDIAVSLQPTLSNHYSTKGVLYHLQLRDYKPPSLQSLPEAIGICRKAMSVYDKSRETSRGRSHFSMIGKIEAIISLLEIVKDLPCFDSEDEKIISYLKGGDTPLDLAEVLHLEDQDFIRTLSTTTREVLNELFANVKFKQATTYDENEVRRFNNAKIRASLLRRKFYEIIGLDKKEFNSEEYSKSLLSSTSQDLDLNQQRAQDILYFNDETLYSAWSNLNDSNVNLIYQLLKPLCLQGHGNHNDMLIYSKACLQLKDKPPVDELDKVVNFFVKKYPNSEWAHLFYYMIHFPVPSGGLARFSAHTKESIKKCVTIVHEKAGSGFRKSGAEYFLGKGSGLNALVNSHEFQWLETKWKTKTQFWRGKQPSERLERVQGQKEAGRNGIISYHGIQIHFDNTLYPKESKDDLWFYLGFTVAGPYAYDPVDNDAYDWLKQRRSLPMTSNASFESSTKSGILSSLSATRVTQQRARSLPLSLNEATACVIDLDEKTCDDPKFYNTRDEDNRSRSDYVKGLITVGGRFSPLIGGEIVQRKKKENRKEWSDSNQAQSHDQWQVVGRKTPKAKEDQTKADGAKSLYVTATCGVMKKTFDPQFTASDGKIHHGAAVLGARKSHECRTHRRDERCDTETTDQCNYAHGWRGDTLQFVCTKCTDEKKATCDEKVKHEPYIWNLGPYLNSSGEIWKKKKAFH